MAVILCGWCGSATNPERCGHCGHEDPARPWIQRGQEPPALRTDAAGRPAVDLPTIRRRLAAAKADIEGAGRTATVDALAEALDVSPRTVRRWREMAR